MTERERVTMVMAARLEARGWDSRPGSVVRDLMVDPMAEMYEILRGEMDAAGVMAGLSQGVAGLLEDEAVDNLASNFRVYRRVGARPSGSIRIVVSSSSPVVLSPGTVFSFGGMTSRLGVPVTAFSGTNPSSGGVTAVQYVRMRQSGANWYFDIPLSADEATDASVDAGAPVVMSHPPRNLVSALVSSAFTGGSVNESSRELAARALDSGAAAVPSGRIHIINALVEALALEPGDIGVSSPGDPFLLRGRSPLTGVSTGGAADVFIRTSFIPRLVEVPAVAVKQGSERLVYLGGEDAAGVVSIKSVATEVREVSGSSLVVSYGVSMDGSEVGAATGDQARGSAYQTISILASGLGDDSLDPVDVVVSLYKFDGISPAQGLFLQDGPLRSPFLDILVRAPSPLMMGVSFSMSRSLTEDEEDKIKKAVSSTLSGLPIGTSRVDATILVEACMAAVEDARPIFPIIMEASALVDGTSWSSRSLEGFLAAPPESMLVNASNRIWCCPANNVEVL